MAGLKLQGFSGQKYGLVRRRTNAERAEPADAASWGLMVRRQTRDEVHGGQVSMGKLLD